VSLDRVSAALGFGVGVLTGIVAAFVPLGAADPLDPLRGARGAAGSARVTAMRSGLVVAQVALALVLVVGAGLLVRTVHHLTTTSLGFDADGLTTFTVTMPVPKYGTEERQIAYEREMLERLARIPGVTMATASVGFPVVGGVRASLSIQGRSDESGRGEIAYMSMAPGFVESVGMTLKEGRSLTAADRASAPLVVVINETMARQYWPGGGAIGALTRIGPGTGGPLIAVVGIVADVRYHGPTAPVIPAAFGSTLQFSWPRRHFTVRTAGAAANLGAELRAAVRAIDPAVPMGPIQTVDDMVGLQTARHRLVMFALGFFGVVAAALCACGLYGVVALSSQMRRREYAIRMALGAARQGVRWMVVRQAVVLAATGAGAGLLLAALGTRALEGLLHGVAPLDRSTFAVSAAGVLCLAVLSAWLPARAAGRIDPVEALKSEGV
jgi:predicted permease